MLIYKQRTELIYTAHRSALWKKHSSVHFVSQYLKSTIGIVAFLDSPTDQMMSKNVGLFFVFFS